MDVDLQQKLPLRLKPLQAPLRVSLFGDLALAFNVNREKHS